MKEFNWNEAAEAFTDKHAQKLATWRRLSKEFIQELRDKKLIGIHRKHVAFPVKNGCHYRHKDGTWRYTPGSEITPFTLGKIEEGANVHVFESQWDALVFADSSGERDNIIATRGADNGRLAIEALPGSAKADFSGTLVLWPQNDKPKPPDGKLHGYKWANDIKKLFNGQLKIAVVPHEYKDLNEWRKAGATDGIIFNSTIDAKPFDELLQETATAPAERPVNSLAGALDASVVFLNKYMRFEEGWESTIVALWSALSWVYDTFRFTPYLHITSPETNCGKSTLLRCVSKLARKPWTPVSSSAAALYNVIERERPTLLIDEIDTIFGEKAKGDELLRGVLNAGYERGLKLPRMIHNTLKEYEVYCPKVIAGIGNIPNTIGNRSIHVPLSRQSPENRAAIFREMDVEIEIEPIRSFYELWAPTAVAVLTRSRPVMPPELDGRQMDITEPLLALADLAGPEWAEKARDAIVIAFTQGEDLSDSIRLLESMRVLFLTKSAEKLNTKEVLEGLVSMEDANAPWPGWWERQLKNNETRGPAMKLAKMLHGFGISPRAIRFGDAVIKGYDRADFERVWKRYLPSETKSVTMELKLT